MEYPSKRLPREEKVDVNDDKVIYYFTNYYQWDKVKDLLRDDPKRECSERWRVFIFEWMWRKSEM